MDDRRFEDNAKKIGDSLSEFFEQTKLSDKYKETNLIVSWEKIMGKTIASRTSNIYIRDKILFIELKSAPLKQEMNNSKERIMQLISEETGLGVITKVVII